MNDNEKSRQDDSWRPRGGAEMNVLQLDLVRPLLLVGAEGFDAKAHFLDQSSAHEAAHRVRLPSGQFDDLGKGGAPRDGAAGRSLRPSCCPRAHRRPISSRPGAPCAALAFLLDGDFFAVPLTGATSAAGCATSARQTLDRLPDSGDRGLPVRELLDRLQLSEGRDAREAIPDIDQAGHRPVGGEFRQSPFRLVKVVNRSAPAGTSASTVILLSGSIVKVRIATPWITLFKAKGKLKCSITKGAL